MMVLSCFVMNFTHFRQPVLMLIFNFTNGFYFRTPTSRFFNTLYPQPIVLSAGTSFTLPVTFRPLEKTVYNDVIEFTTNVRKLINVL